MFLPALCFFAWPHGFVSSKETFPPFNFQRFSIHQTIGYFFVSRFDYPAKRLAGNIPFWPQPFPDKAVHNLPDESLRTSSKVSTIVFRLEIGIPRGLK